MLPAHCNSEQAPVTVFVLDLQIRGLRLHPPVLGNQSLEVV